MTYSLTATKLQIYGRCAQQFYYRYERKVSAPPSFGSAALGTALHRALRMVHGDWHYMEPFIPWYWVEQCWEECSQELTEDRQAEGLQILRVYADKFLSDLVRRPLALEGRIEAELIFHHVPFKVSGRYDRLEYNDNGFIHLIDYKSQKSTDLPTDGLDLQIGLYYLALEQRYHAALDRMSLLFLRTGEMVSFQATLEHRQRVLEVVSDLALKLHSEDWSATPGDHCKNCGYRKYCAAVTFDPLPLPELGQESAVRVQLAFA